jgi:hypothetical protein
MADLSSLSNEELVRLAQQEQSRRKISSMTDDELRAAAYVQPKPPPGVTMHTQGGPVFIGPDGKPQKSTMAEAEQRMLRERDGIASDVRDSVLRGVPYAGAFFPRARAAMSGGDYAQNLEREQARAKTFDQDYPVASLGGKVVGGVLGTVAAAPVPYVRGAFGLGGNSALGSMAYGGAAGLAQGAAQGAGESTDLTNRNDVAKNAGISGAFGAALGAAIPGAIAGVVSAKDWFAGKMNPDTLSQIPSAASRFLTKQFDDPARVAQMRGEMQRLGPGAVLADASPEMQGIAGGAATRPGSRSAILDALSGRDAGKNARIQGAVNSNFGPDAIPSQIEAQIKEAKSALSPQYEQAFAGTKEALDTAPIAQTLQDLASGKRGAAQKAASDVREMLAFPGTNILDGSPRTLHQVRVAIDGMMDGELNRDVLRTLQTARKAIDDELAAKVPGIKPIDAQYADLSRQWEAFKTGQRTFDVGRETVLRPSELALEQAKLTQPAGTAAGPPTRGGLDRLSEGARSEIERIVGTKANDVAALNQLLKGEGDWNRDKLRLLFGNDKADRVLETLDRERVFENTFRRTTGNSETASRQSFGKLLDAIATPARPDASRSMFGTVVELGKKGVDRVRGAQGEEQAARIAEALARVSVSEGPQADALIQALMTRSGRAQTNKAIFGASGAAGPQMSPILEAIAYDLYRDDKRKAQR